MNYIDAAVFGFVHGITEFLPISSTAHIIIAQLILGYTFPGLAFEIFLHLSSVLAVMLYYRKDLAQITVGFFSYLKEKNYKDKFHFYFGLYIIVATAITGGLGILIMDMTMDFMKTPTFLSVTLIITGVLLIGIERFHKYGSRTEKEMTFIDSIVVGIAQAIAVLPGLSRSGLTLVSGLWIGLSRETAVKYSFLLAIPVILGSSVLWLGDVSAGIWAEIGLNSLIIAFVVNFIFSMIAIIWLIDFLKKSRLVYFAVYCFIVAVLVFLFLDPAMVID